MISGSDAAPRKHLALNTDWASAFGMGLLFCLCSLFAAVSAKRILHGPVSLEPVTWQTWVWLGMLAWLFIRARGEHKKTVQMVTGVLAIGPASRILLRAFHASVDTQLANAAFVRVIDDFIFIGGCVFAVWWFKSKLRYVD